MGTTRARAEGNLNRSFPNHTAETIDCVRRIWNADQHTARQIGDMVGLTRSAVIGIAHRHPDFINKGHGALDEAFVSEVRAMWESWMTGPMIARRTEMTKTAIYSMARRYGWPKRSELYGGG